MIRYIVLFVGIVSLSFFYSTCNISRDGNDAELKVQAQSNVNISSDSMLVLGYNYLISGENPDSALYWLENSSSKGNDNATFYLGQTFLFGYGEVLDVTGSKTGIKQNEKKGEELLLKLSKKNNPKALSSLAEYYLSKKHDTSTGLEFLKRGIALNDPQLIFELGYLYYYGAPYGSNDVLNIDLRQEEGIDLIIKSADLKYVPAIYKIGVMCINGNQYLKKDSQKARHYLESLLDEESLNEEIGIDKSDIEDLLKKIE